MSARVGEKPVLLLDRRRGRRPRWRLGVAGACRKDRTEGGGQEGAAAEGFHGVAAAGAGARFRTFAGSGAPA
jgi:hypothetical protein